jgi:lipoprotein-anchoring transpeptidase ErfK/SrfK
MFVTLMASAAGHAAVRSKVPAKPQQLSVPLNGPDAAEAIRGMQPGQYLWAPEISPAGPILAIISLPVQRCYVYRNGVLIAVSTVSSGMKGRQTPTGVFTVRASAWVSGIARMCAHADGICAEAVRRDEAGDDRGGDG